MTVLTEREVMEWIHKTNEVLADLELIHMGLDKREIPRMAPGQDGLNEPLSLFMRVATLLERYDSLDYYHEQMAKQLEARQIHKVTT